MSAALSISPSLDEHSDRPDVRIDGCAFEPSPIYPAIFAATLFDERERGAFARVHVRAQPTIPALFDAVAQHRCTLATMSAQAASRAILAGLPAKIVSLAAAPVDSAAFDGNAVLVAPARWVQREPALVRAAIDAYWEGARRAMLEPTMLSVVLVTELGLSPQFAQLEALRAIRAWESAPTRLISR